MEERIERGRELFELGRRLGGLGTVVIGSAGGELARTLARSAGCGAALAGAPVRFHDGSCAACGAWLGRYYRLPSTLFVRQRGSGTCLYVLDGQGRPFQPPESSGGCGPCAGDWDLLTGADSAWAAVRAGELRLGGTAAAAGAAALTLALERMGCAVVERPRPGVPLFRTDEEGFALTVELDGRTFYPPGEDALSALSAFAEQPPAIPAFQPERELL